MNMSKYREMFFSEAKEHLNNMNQVLISLEKNPSDAEGIDALFRDAHSIKGMAASMGYDNTAELAHYLEDLMDGFRNGGAIPPEMVDRLLAGMDLLEGLMEDLAAERPERDIDSFISDMPTPSVPEPEGAAQTKASAPGHVKPNDFLVTLELVPNALIPSARALLALKEMALLGEVVSSSPSERKLSQGGPLTRLEVRLQTEKSHDQIKNILYQMPDIERVDLAKIEKKHPQKETRRAETPKSQKAAAPAPTPSDGAAQTVRVRTDMLDRFINLTGELITNRYSLQSATENKSWPDVQEGLHQLYRLIGDLYHQVLQVRMMPMENIAGRLPRQVRDLCRKSGKEVDLRLEGMDVELDRTILEKLADPLMHMVRNAVDHGIEQCGKLTIRAWREKDLIFVEVADDGKGMDPALILEKAIEKKLLSPEQARSLTDRDILQLVCQPGFSTATQVTEVSGRGVGMDVVKSSIEQLGGTLEIFSELGKGTSIQLKLPLSLAIIHILLVECEGHNLGIPVTRVLRTLEIERDKIRKEGKQLMICLEEEKEQEAEEELIPLLSLRKVLDLPNRAYPGRIPVVVTEMRGRKVGLVVDRFAGQRQAFVKALVPPLNRLAGVGGATILGDGSVVFIIDPQFLLEERIYLPTTSFRGGQQ